MILASVARKADRQLSASRKARTKGPAEGSSEKPAGTGPLSRGSGGSKGTTVAEAENSSRPLPRIVASSSIRVLLDL